MPSAHAAAFSGVEQMPKFGHEVILETPRAEAEKIIHDSIISGALAREWDIVSDDGKTLRLKIVVRGRHTVVIDVRVVDDGVAVDYVSSVNMSYGKGGESSGDECAVVAVSSCTKAGEHIHVNYGRWVRNLLLSARKAAKRF